MFVMTRRRPTGESFAYRRGPYRQQFYLCETTRKDGKVARRDLCYLGSATAMSMRLLPETLARVRRFALERIQECIPERAAEAEAALAKKLDAMLAEAAATAAAASAAAASVEIIEVDD